MTLFTNISKLHTFHGVYGKEGRNPKVSDFGSIEDGTMLVDRKGVIVWVGRRQDFLRFSKTKSASWRSKIKRVSLGNAVVLPAFAECHTHLLYAGSRADEFERRNRGDSYLDIQASGGGIRATVRATEAMSEKNQVSLLIERLRSLAQQGATTVEIKTGYASTIASELRALNLLFKLQQRTAKMRLPRVVITCLAAHSIPDGETETTWLKKVEALLPELKRVGARLDIFIEKGAFSLSAGRQLLKKAVDQEISVVIHADQLSRTGGTELGCELEARSVDHVIEADSADILKLSRSKTVAVLLPAADLYTRLPFPNARAMIDSGVRVALATDHNPGTSPGLDLALVGVLARTAMQMTAPEVFAAYTVNAACALGFESKLGVLHPGFFGDFICLQKEASLADLFYEIGPTRSHAAVKKVWRAGQRIF